MEIIGMVVEVLMPGNSVYQLDTLDFCFWGYMKEFLYQEKSQAQNELL
jgi:hypothetical protein